MSKGSVGAAGDGSSFPGSIDSKNKLASGVARAKSWQREARTVHVYFDITAGGAEGDNAPGFLTRLPAKGSEGSR
ncbi:hypothetical protein [Methylacidimicrobium sp. B4]|uniref:hypothetical protein n=1 Tax=Methylacidimicrobium sp. B4 TaxID=2796139 RepID=UPI001A8D73A1|nr:hypothetical protein [Methylacidimicrobium sp. B4]QSR84951.1 hypothetical protein MacB4_01360 [Methylacidimicrobium sp. B4]